MKTWHGLLVLSVPVAMGACDSPCTFTEPEIPSAASTEGAGGAVGGHGGELGGEGGALGGAGGTGVGGTGGAVGGEGGALGGAGGAGGALGGGGGAGGGALSRRRATSIECCAARFAQRPLVAVG
jgi:hypothetical protein